MKPMRDSADTHTKIIIVRVNGQESDLFEADIATVVVPGVHVINLPKVESAQDVLAAVELIEAAERKASLDGTVGLLANIETPKGLRCAYEIASAHRRVLGLQIGFLDMSRACGFESGNLSRPHDISVREGSGWLRLRQVSPRSTERVCRSVKNQDGFRAEAREARASVLRVRAAFIRRRSPWRMKSILRIRRRLRLHHVS